MKPFLLLLLKMAACALLVMAGTTRLLKTQLIEHCRLAQRSAVVGYGFGQPAQPFLAARRKN